MRHKPVRKTALRPAPRRMRGFEKASGLIGAQIRTASEKRGFAVARLLTHWEEVVGAATARVCRPVKVGYGRGGIGATLTLLTTGAQATVLEMQKEKIRARVNACYGYAAIARIRITQSAPSGFAEGQVAFEPSPAAARKPGPTPEVVARTARIAGGVADDALRRALAELGQNVLSRHKPA